MNRRREESRSMACQIGGVYLEVVLQRFVTFNFLFFFRLTGILLSFLNLQFMIETRDKQLSIIQASTPVTHCPSRISYCFFSNVADSGSIAAADWGARRSIISLTFSKPFLNSGKLSRRNERCSPYMYRVSLFLFGPLSDVLIRWRLLFCSKEYSLIRSKLID